ncbi:unnamed protein product [Parajaminaea phylloscopi]
MIAPLMRNILLLAICLYAMALSACAAPEKLGTCYDVTDQCTFGHNKEDGKRDIFGSLTGQTTLYGGQSPPCRAFRSISARDLNVCQCTVAAGCRFCQRVNNGGCVDIGNVGLNRQYLSLAPA